MKTIISPNGYFYKEYKNGKKKRISKKEFYKFNNYKIGGSIAPSNTPNILNNNTDSSILNSETLSNYRLLIEKCREKNIFLTFNSISNQFNDNNDYEILTGYIKINDKYILIKLTYSNKLKDFFSLYIYNKKKLCGIFGTNRSLLEKINLFIIKFIPKCLKFSMNFNDILYNQEEKKNYIKQEYLDDIVNKIKLLNKRELNIISLSSGLGIFELIILEELLKKTHKISSSPNLQLLTKINLYLSDRSIHDEQKIYNQISKISNKFKDVEIECYIVYFDFCYSLNDPFPQIIDCLISKNFQRQHYFKNVQNSENVEKRSIKNLKKINKRSELKLFYHKLNNNTNNIVEDQNIIKIFETKYS